MGTDRGLSRLSSSAPPCIYYVLRLVGWNTLLLVIGLALIAGVGEIWHRSTTPFLQKVPPRRFVPKVGLIWKPNTEIRWTNGLDFWTISRTNSLGFLDREPSSHKHTEAGCHITMIGDSLVEAKEVPIAEKFHVRIEDLATHHLPSLNITTSAFGRSGTGQINQLPFYDELARHLHPKLVVLVFVANDFGNNLPVLAAIKTEHDPDHSPFVTAAPDENGTITVRPPNPDYKRLRFQRHDQPWFTPVRDWLVQKSRFVVWIQAKRAAGRLFLRANYPGSFPLSRAQIARVELLKRSSAYEVLLNGWHPTTLGHMDGRVYRKTIPPVLEAAVEITAFALEQFKTRVARANASLVILSTHTMGTQGSVLFDRMSSLAEAKGIPIINQYDYILRQGGKIEDAHWAHDDHWNPTGHRWAAEALLEYLKQHPEICDGAEPR